MKKHAAYFFKNYISAKKQLKCIWISCFYYNILNGNGECEIPICFFKCGDIVMSVKSIMKKKITQLEYKMIITNCQCILRTYLCEFTA